MVNDPDEPRASADFGSLEPVEQINPDEPRASVDFDSLFDSLEPVEQVVPPVGLVIEDGSDEGIDDDDFEARHLGGVLGYGYTVEEMLAGGADIDDLQGYGIS